ncbi:DsrE family protein [Chitinophaga sp. Hz27]|uniref:DsrE family protein n=1 Tax=Chitinophaga sp. Hz27 TaxID=3347169 RepID=UPI0035E0B660
MQVVFQITSEEESAKKAMLGQINNLLDYCMENNKRIVVEVAVHGKAYGLLLQQENPLLELVNSLAARSVRWMICKNTMKSHHIQETALPDYVVVIPSAVAHLVERQLNGWAYIKC